MVVTTQTTSTKPKKTALEHDDFIAMVDSRVKSLSYDYCIKHNSMEIPAKIKRQFESQVAKDIENRFRVKGTRSGHINKASADIQTKFNSLKEQVELLTFSYDNVDYVCTVLCKKVVEKEQIVP